MMPLGDEDSQRQTMPIITYLLIAINVLFFFVELSGGEEFIKRWAFIPQRFSANPSGDFITLLTSMFMHAGFGHLLGNMLYLWIFGDNIEDYLGKGQYLLLYFLSGLAATFAQYIIDPQANIPNIGASGAIAGVLGAYILFFPGHKIRVLLGQSIIALPSLIVIGFWFLLQLASSAGSLYSTHEAGGVAYMAHVGGFLAGLAVAFLFHMTKRDQLKH